VAKKKFSPTRFMLPNSHYDKARADHAVAFIENLKHTKGVWAGQPFDLIPWQEELIRNVFGVVKATGYRQFNTVFTEIPKKTGKSELAAAVALYMLCADGEQGAEVYGCATDRQQASIVFSVAVDMILQCPALKKRVKIVESQKRILFEPTRSIYQVLSSEVASKYGYNVHACIFDELLGQPNRRLFDVMTKGAGAARKQPLNFVITTAGSDKNSICYEVHSKAEDILEGRKHDSTFYPVVYSAPNEADWTDPEVWRSVNPSLGVTVEEEYLRLSCESAKQNPAEEMQFRQFFLCQWTSTAVRWMPMEKWDKCALAVNPEELRGRTCYGGLDLSSTTDITAFVLVFPPTDEDDKYKVLPFFWMPEDNIDLRVRRDHVPYDVWMKQGYLLTTEGNVVHYGFIENFIEELGLKYNIKEIAFDRWGAVQMVQNLEGLGFTVVPFGQGFKDMSPPTKELMKLTLEEKLAHGGHPVLRWMVDNIFIKTDPAGNVKPDKEKSTERIDGAVATIMALDRAIRHRGDSNTSVYDHRGLLVL
jgi:phage terminase large subunit-like protein